MKHANCGGDLKKSDTKAGQYRCALCRQVVKLGASGGFGRGYIQKQGYALKGQK